MLTGVRGQNPRCCGDDIAFFKKNNTFLGIFGLNLCVKTSFKWLSKCVDAFPRPATGARAFTFPIVATPLVQSASTGAKPLCRNKVTHSVITLKF